MDMADEDLNTSGLTPPSRFGTRAILLCGPRKSPCRQQYKKRRVMCLLARRQAFIVIHHMQVSPCEADTVENLCNGFIESSDSCLMRSY